MRRPARLSLALALLLVLAAPAAHAQFGSLGKKLAKKATDKATGAAESQGIEKAAPAAGGGSYDPAVIGEPLDEETLARVLKGLKLATTKMAETQRTWEQSIQLRNQSQAILDAHRKEADAYQAESERVQECRDKAFAKLHEEREAQIAAKQAELQSNPAKAQQLAAQTQDLMMKMAELQQKGDTEAVQQLQMEFYRKVMGTDPRADSARVLAQCPAMPAKPAWLTQAETLDSRANQLQNDSRDGESAALAAGAKLAGLPAGPFALARERLVTWRSATSGGRPDLHFSAAENDLFAAHRAEILAATNPPE